MAIDIQPELISETPNTVTMVLQKKSPMQSKTIFWTVLGLVAAGVSGGLSIIGEAAPALIPIVATNPWVHAGLILASTVAAHKAVQGRKAVGDIQ